MAIRRMFPVNPKPGIRSQLWTLMDDVGQYIEDALGQPVMFSRSEAVRVTRGEKVADVLASRGGKSAQDIALVEVEGKQKAQQAVRARKLASKKAVEDKRFTAPVDVAEEVMSKGRKKAGN